MTNLRSKFQFRFDLEVEQLAAEWDSRDSSVRLWERDASLWTDSGEQRWMDWLDLASDGLRKLDSYLELANFSLNSAVDDVVIVGMGGATLCAEALRSNFGTMEGRPIFHVLDSIDPSQIRTLEDRISIDRAMFVVSSKSGTTLETVMLTDYFFDSLCRRISVFEAGKRFLAVTDSGSSLEMTSKKRQFVGLFHGHTGVGGRFSALSAFGLVPASMMGIDIKKLLTRAVRMIERCGPNQRAEENPGVLLGLQLAVALRQSRNKVTFISSDRIRGFRVWLEQLLAESTGKNGRGVIPVEGESLGSSDEYRNDRFFVYLHYRNESTGLVDNKLEKMMADGHPVLRIEIGDRYDLGAEFFRWQMATAVVCADLKVNPFDQPDVEVSKRAVRRLSVRNGTREGYETEIVREPVGARGIRVVPYGNGTPISDKQLIEEILREHVSNIRAGDYFSVLAYIEMNREHEELLNRLRMMVRSYTRSATCVGFGPRFLHSTGQLHKGGPNTGVYLQITCDDPIDFSLAGTAWTFGSTKAAQAQGDLNVLTDRNRRIVRVHLVGGVIEGLNRIEEIMKKVFASNE